MRFLFISFLLLSFPSFSQSPGGVGTANLRGWFDATTGITLTGGAVSGWQDRASVGNASQATAGERPTVSTATINYNDALRFDGANDNMDLNDRMANTVTSISAYALARQTATTADTWGSIFNGQANGAAWTGGGYGLVALNAASTQHGFYVRDYDTKGVAFPVTNGTPFLISGTWNGTTANNVEAFKNGSSVGTVAYTPGSVGDNGSSWIGSGNGAGGNYCFYGDIAEIIIFNTGLSTANNNKVMSYLAVKYGLTMGINYTNSAGTTIYTTAGAYTNNIIGITRDDGSGLIQKQSKNEDDSVRIYLSTLAGSNSSNSGTFGSNLSHVIIGANNGKMCGASSTTAEIPSGYGIVRRLDREWKVTNTNFNGTYSIDFKINACALPSSVTVSDLRLLIDDDGNFSAGTNTSVASGSGGITITYANPIITVSGISTSLIASGSTRYITIGSANVLTPLPIKLLNFTANEEDTKVRLNWAMATEKNNDYFQIERSIDGVKFESIGMVDGADNSVIQKNYVHYDQSPLDDVSYYRIKQVDYDGTFEYSHIVAVSKNKKASMGIYPNPSKSDFNVEISSNGKNGNSTLTCEVFDPLGKLVIKETWNISGGFTKKSISLNESQNGIYFMKISIDEETILTKRLIKE